MADTIESHVLERYEIVQRIGKGSWGIWKAIDKKYNKVVFLKQIYSAFRDSNDAQRTYREVMYLQALGTHRNIVQLRNVIRAKNNLDLYLIFEYVETDLHSVIRANLLEDIHRQYIMYQLFKAVKYIHSAGLIHRHLKPSHILINSEATIKVTSFSHARSLHVGDDKDGKFSDDSGTRWYRAPEQLFGSTEYSQAVDMWAMGCILGELFAGKAIFPGQSSINQIEKILELLARPRPEDVKAIDSPHIEQILSCIDIPEQKSFEIIFPNASADAVDLLKRLLTFNPEKRITVEEALKHKYVAQFSCPEEEITLDHTLELPLNDFTKFSAEEYREAIYKHILKKKKERRRKLEEAKLNEIVELIQINKNPSLHQPLPESELKTQSFLKSHSSISQQNQMVSQIANDSSSKPRNLFEKHEKSICGVKPKSDYSIIPETEYKTIEFNLNVSKKTFHSCANKKVNDYYQANMKLASSTPKNILNKKELGEIEKRKAKPKILYKNPSMDDEGPLH